VCLHIGKEDIRDFMRFMKAASPNAFDPVTKEMRNETHRLIGDVTGVNKKLGLPKSRRSGGAPNKFMPFMALAGGGGDGVGQRHRFGLSALVAGVGNLTQGDALG
jgi:hypothetical protein